MKITFQKSPLIIRHSRTVCGLSVDGIIDSLFPCQLFVQDIHLEQNYDLVSNKIHFQIDLFFQIVPVCRIAMVRRFLFTELSSR